MADVIHPPVPRRLTEAFFTVAPTRWTVFLRTFIPYQVVRFAVINLKMLRIIQISHAGHPRRDAPHRGQASARPAEFPDDTRD